MKRLFCLLASASLFLPGCVTPDIHTHTSPPGVFVGLPVVPLELGIQLRADH